MKLIKLHCKLRLSSLFLVHSACKYRMTGLSESLSIGLPYLEFKFNLPYLEFLGVFSSSILSLRLFSSAWFYCWYYVLFSYQVAPKSMKDWSSSNCFTFLWSLQCSSWVCLDVKPPAGSDPVPYIWNHSHHDMCRRHLPDYIPTLSTSVLLRSLEKLKPWSCTPWLEWDSVRLWLGSQGMLSVFPLSVHL